LYFDVRYWQWFRAARLEVEYENVAGVEWGMGYKAGAGFQWNVKNIETTKQENKKTNEESGTQKVILEFDLRNEFVERGNVHRWIVSAPDVSETGKGIRIYNLRLLLSK